MKLWRIRSYLIMEKVCFAECEGQESLYKYVKDFNEEKVPGEQKDEILRTGIGLLNEELFDKDRFELFDKIAIHLNRREQWIKILQDFVKQLQEHAALFNKKQLDTACYVEEMLGGTGRKQEWCFVRNADTEHIE